MARAKRFGYVLDLNPDLQVAHVSPNVFLSSQDVAQEFKLLKENGITHIINVATAVANFFPKNFVYLQIQALDCPDTNLKIYFHEVIDFIQNAIKSHGKVILKFL